MVADAKLERSTKPFPWRCGHCQEKAVYRDTVEYSTICGHDDREYTITLPDLVVPKCRVCGEMLFDTEANERITEALREHLGLLKPSQIRTGRESLGLTQEQFATKLRITSSTVSFWESGFMVQQSAMDLLMRLFFGLTEVRSAIANEETLHMLGETAA